MRIKETNAEFQLAKLLLDIIGISKNIREISEEFESIIKEKSGDYHYEDEEEEEEEDNGQGGWSYHDIELLSDFEPQQAIDGILSEKEIQKLVEFSINGDLAVNIARLNTFGNSYEWSFDLLVPKSPHFTRTEKFTLHIRFSYLFGYEKGGQVMCVYQDISKDELEKIYTAYALVHS